METLAPPITVMLASDVTLHIGGLHLTRRARHLFGRKQGKPIIRPASRATLPRRLFIAELARGSRAGCEAPETPWQIGRFRAAEVINRPEPVPPRGRAKDCSDCDDQHATGNANEMVPAKGEHRALQ